MHVTLVGHGRLGSALAEGWRRAGVADDLAVLTRADVPRCPPETAVVAIAVKPSGWRQAVAALSHSVPRDATILSVMAGVLAADIAAALPGHPVVRVMPTTAVAEGQGVAAIWSADPSARALAHALFDPVADTVDLADEALMDAATAVAGSAPAFFYAFVDALVLSGVKAGLNREDAKTLARGALRSAGAGAASDQDLESLMARIASPGGTTQAGLSSLAQGGLADLVDAAVRAAVARSRALSADQPT